MKFLAPLLFLLICNPVFCQLIPEQRRVDWSIAGLENAIPGPSLIMDVTDFGAVGDSSTDNYAAITEAIAALDEQYGVICFPPGNYIIRSPIVMRDSLIFRGAGSEQSRLLFDLGGLGYNCFSISGQTGGEFIEIESGFEKGNTQLQVDDAEQFIPGAWAEIRQDNGAWDTEPISWAGHSVGQMVKITEVEEDHITIKNPLRIDYDEELEPEIRAIQPTFNAGIECLGIYRLDDPDDVGYNVFFNYAMNCWVKGVESSYSEGSHIYITKSSNILISGCYIHDAWEYDGSGTRGYGVTLNMHAGECLIEDNIFKHLRHAMMVKTGANGNVFAYNYSIEPYRIEPIHDFSGDISLHGHYAFSNLFEGNVVQNIIIDHYWGPSGPYNTMFRNRAELWGIIMTGSDTTETSWQNFVGNETTNFEDLHGNYELSGSDHFEHGNNIRGIIIPEGTGYLEDVSYYLSGQPVFWDVFDDWPSIGIPNPLDDGIIPAKYRYEQGVYTVCGDSGIYTRNDEVYFSEGEVKVWPVPFASVLNVKLPDANNEYTIRLFDADGGELIRTQSAGPVCKINTSGIQAGIYFLKISGKGFDEGIKILKK